MASIQQAMNQMIGTASAGIITASHLHKASPAYQQKKINERTAQEAEAAAVQHEKEANALATQRDEKIAEIKELRDKRGRHLGPNNPQYRQKAHELERLYDDYEAHLRKAHQKSPTAKREQALKELPERHESIALAKDSEQREKEKKVVSIQQQKKAEADALARLEFEARTLGITAEQLEARKAFLKEKEATK